MHDTVAKSIEKEKLIVIVRGVQKEKLVPLCEAMYQGGIRLLEVTFDARKEVPDEETAENIRRLQATFKGRMYIGAGTVLTKKQVELVKEAGGYFIISPNTDKDVIETTRALGLVSIPGALTPSEIKAADSYGADFVKLFPITSLGASYVKAIKAPLAHIKLTAVGGINDENMKEYLAAGVSGFGIGTNIVDKTMLENNDYEGITELAKQYVRCVK